MKILHVIVFLFFSIFGFCQNNSDVELWSGFNYKIKLNKKWHVNLAPEMRFADNISTLNKTFLDIGVRYNITKRWCSELNYRYTYSPASNNKDRINLDFAYDWKRKNNPWSLEYRLRLQRTRTRITGSSENYIRNKFSIDYNLSKLVDPFVAFEIYFKLNKNEFRNTRYTVGLNWKLTKNFSLKTFYLYQKEIYVKNPSSEHIFGLGLAYGYKLRKKSHNSSLD